jgi:hypothetical protein
MLHKLVKNESNGGVHESINDRSRRPLCHDRGCIGSTNEAECNEYGSRRRRELELHSPVLAMFSPFGNGSYPVPELYSSDICYPVPELYHTEASVAV